MDRSDDLFGGMKRARLLRESKEKALRKVRSVPRVPELVPGQLVLDEEALYWAELRKRRDARDAGGRS